MFLVSGMEEDVPTTTYYGQDLPLVNFALTLGLARATGTASEGPFYYTGAYERAQRYARQTVDKKPLVVANQAITHPGTSFYKQGAICRVYLRMGKTKVTLPDRLPDSDEETNSWGIVNPNGAWTMHFDSRVQTTSNKAGKTMHAQYITADYDQAQIVGFQQVSTQT